MSEYLKVRPGVRWVKEGDGAVLLDTRSSRYFRLNPLALDIWQQIELGSSLPAIEDHLRRLHDVPASCLHRDVAELIDFLKGAGLIIGASR